MPAGAVEDRDEARVRRAGDEDANERDPHRGGVRGRRRGVASRPAAGRGGSRWRTSLRPPSVRGRWHGPRGGPSAARPAGARPTAPPAVADPAPAADPGPVGEPRLDAPVGILRRDGGHPFGEPPFSAAAPACGSFLGRKGRARLARASEPSRPPDRVRWMADLAIPGLRPGAEERPASGREPPSASGSGPRATAAPSAAAPRASSRRGRPFGPSVQPVESLGVAARRRTARRPPRHAGEPRRLGPARPVERARAVASVRAARPPVAHAPRPPPQRLLRRLAPDPECPPRAAPRIRRRRSIMPRGARRAQAGSGGRLAGMEADRRPAEPRDPLRSFHAGCEGGLGGPRC